MLVEPLEHHLAIAVARQRLDFCLNRQLRALDCLHVEGDHGRQPARVQLSELLELSLLIFEAAARLGELIAAGAAGVAVMGGVMRAADLMGMPSATRCAFRRHAPTAATRGTWPSANSG